MNATFVCPHCEFRMTAGQKILDFIGAKEYTPFLVNCDVEMGGCGKYFVATMKVEVIIKTQKVEIEDGDN